MSFIKQTEKGELSKWAIVLMCSFLFLSTCLSASAAPEAAGEYEHWSEWLTAERDGICYPDEVIRLAGIKRGDSVADIGAGAGYFTFRIGKVVGSYGRCFAVDFKYTGELAEYIHRKIGDKNLNPYNNVYPIRNRYSDVMLPESSVDVAFMYLTGLYVTDPERYEGNREYEVMRSSQKMLMESIYRALKPGGRFVVVDLIATEDEIREYDQKGEILCYAATNIEAVEKNFECLGLELIESHDLYQTMTHAENIKKFKKSPGYCALGKSRNFLGRKMFFYVFEKPEV